MRFIFSGILLLVIAPSVLWAGKADVLDVKVVKTAERTYSFSVTVRHKDEGWKHYANRWEVVSLNGNILATRVLAHPHVHEQPFTRSLGNVKLPLRVKQVRIRAIDSKHKSAGKEILVKLP